MITTTQNAKKKYDNYLIVEATTIKQKAYIKLKQLQLVSTVTNLAGGA